MADEFAALNISLVDESAMRQDVATDIVVKTSREELEDVKTLQSAWAALQRCETDLEELNEKLASSPEGSSEHGRIRFAMQSAERDVQQKAKELQKTQVEVERRRKGRREAELRRQQLLAAQELEAAAVSRATYAATHNIPNHNRPVPRTSAPRMGERMDGDNTSGTGAASSSSLSSSSVRPSALPPGLHTWMYGGGGSMMNPTLSSLPSPSRRSSAYDRMAGVSGVRTSNVSSAVEEYSGGSLLPSLNAVRVSRADIRASAAKYEDDGDSDVFAARQEKRRRLEALAALAEQSNRPSKKEEKEEEESRLSQRTVKRESSDADMASTTRSDAGGHARSSPPPQRFVVDVDAIMEENGGDDLDFLLESAEHSSQASAGQTTRAVKMVKKEEEKPLSQDGQRRVKRERSSSSTLGQHFDMHASSDEDEDDEVDGDESGSDRATDSSVPASLAHLNDQDLTRLAESYKEPLTTITPTIRIATSIYDRLLDYQVVGLQWLIDLHLTRSGGILGDEMGLGKTIQVAALINALHESGQLLGPCLIGAPLTVLRQWVSELHRWAPHVRVCIMHESSSSSLTRTQLIQSVRGTPSVVLTTYSALRQHHQLLRTAGFQYLILDEGHKICNPDASVTIAAKTFTTPHRLILSGSPIQNTLKELWCLFDFVKPGLLGTLHRFIEEFDVPINASKSIRASQLTLATAVECARILQSRISPYLLRRLKKQVNTMLPQKFERVIRCPLSEQQLQVYVDILMSPEVQRLLNDATGRQLISGRLDRDGRDYTGSLHTAGRQFQMMRGQKGSSGMMHAMFRIMNVLRQVCNHADIYTLKTAAKEEQEAKAGSKNASNPPKTKNLSFRSNNPVNYEGSSKLKTLLLMMREWKRFGHRVLVFSQQRMVLDIVENMCEQEDFRYVRMDGTTNSHIRQQIMDRYNKDESIFAALLTTRVGGIGVNLVGADRIVIFDPDWNPVTDEQARERAWRIGQTRDVCIYRMITSGTVEECVLRRQLAKTYVTEKVLKDPALQRFFHQNESLAESFFLGTEYDSQIPIGKKHVMVAQELIPHDDVTSGAALWGSGSDDDDDDDDSDDKAQGEENTRRTPREEGETRNDRVKREPGSQPQGRQERAAAMRGRTGQRREREFGIALPDPASASASEPGVKKENGPKNKSSDSTETSLLQQLVDGANIAVSGADRVAQRLARHSATQAMLRVSGEISVDDSSLTQDRRGRRNQSLASLFPSGSPYSLMRPPSGQGQQKQ